MDIASIVEYGCFVEYGCLIEKRCQELIDNGMVFEANFLQDSYVKLSGCPERSYELLLLTDNEVSDLAYKALKRVNEQTGASTSLLPAKRTRGLCKKTIRLRENILDAFTTIKPPFTVRQMFYQMSKRKVVEKDDSGYRQVQSQLLKMRREGVIKYSWIADNTRWMRKPDSFKSMIDVLRHYQYVYRQDLWLKSPCHVEIWCEKDAIASAIYDVTMVYDVPLYPARGYSSETFTFEAAQNIAEIDKPTFIYYVGDFDPSGWHMGEDLRKKLFEYSDIEHKIVFRRLATNKSQIEELKLQDAERETKESDTRCKAFFELFGDKQKSVEIEGISPDDLRNIVKNAIEQHINHAELEAVKREESAARDSFMYLANAYAKDEETA